MWVIGKGIEWQGRNSARPWQTSLLAATAPPAFGARWPTAGRRPCLVYAIPFGHRRQSRPYRRWRRRGQTQSDCAAPSRFAAASCSGGSIAGDSTNVIAPAAARRTRAGTALPLPLEWASGMSRLAAHAAPQSSCSPRGAQAALICCPLGVSSARTEGLATTGVVSRRRGSPPAPCPSGPTSASLSSSPAPCEDSLHAATAPGWLKIGGPWGAGPTGVGVDGAALSRTSMGVVGVLPPRRFEKAEAALGG